MSGRSTQSERGDGVVLDGFASLAGQSAESGMVAEVTAIRHARIPQAVDQLAAVVKTTERAANQIMDACDALSALGQELGGPAADRIEHAVTMIFEACGFQDLTGQRIVNVTKTLRAINSVLGKLTRQMNGEPIDDLSADDDVWETGPERLEGPQCGDDAIDQSAADRLFSQSS
jgi:chemotaxis protein CheZ